jgi:hypothetical protein
MMITFFLLRLPQDPVQQVEDVNEVVDPDHGCFDIKWILLYGHIGQVKSLQKFTLFQLISY